MVLCFRRFAFTLALISAAIAQSAVAAGPEPTRILDPAMAQKLVQNRGITLQWIDWDQTGTAFVDDTGGVWTLRASQSQADGPGSLFLDGRIVEIGSDYFLFDGVVRIKGTPDTTRHCEKRDVWRFAITQNRPYWRIRQFEWCDNLTDYIDIYFPAGTR